MTRLSRDERVELEAQRRDHVTPLSPVEREAMAARHTPVRIAEDAPHEQTTLCSRDEEIWPCDAARYEATLRAVEADAERLAEALERHLRADVGNTRDERFLYRVRISEEARSLLVAHRARTEPTP